MKKETLYFSDEVRAQNFIEICDWEATLIQRGEAVDVFYDYDEDGEAE